MSALDLDDATLAAIERAARAVAPGHWYIRSGEPDCVRAEIAGSRETFRYVVEGRAMATDAYFITKAQPERVLAMVAEIRRLRAERAPAVSREAGEIVDAVLDACGVRFDQDDSAAVLLLQERGAVKAAAIVQRALDAAEERGAEAADEQRAIERRGGPER